MSFENLIGKKFGKLTVIELAPKTKNRSILWRCICDCGNKKIVRNKNLLEGIITDCGCESNNKYNPGQKISRLTLLKEIPACRGRSWECLCDCGNILRVEEYNIRNGVVKSCGCLAQEIRSVGNIIHGLYKTRISEIYHSMKQRCYNEKHVHYKNYGGRGISICPEWIGENGFINFYRWAVDNGYNELLSIDRIDNNKNYSPDNCKWSTPTEQQNNTRFNRWLEYRGEKLTLTQMSRKYNINIGTLWCRLKKFNGDVCKAIEEPIHTEKQRFKIKGGN